MSRPVLVLTHARWETPGLIEAALGDIPSIQRTVLDEHDPTLPDIDALGGLVVMGGPQDANDDVRHPGLAAERRLLARAVSADVPVFGVCLGMQLLALSLGATLHLRHGTELGFLPVELNADGARDPVLGPFGEIAGATFLHWHTDAVELPRGATLLASTAMTPVQAFRIGSAFATQFHPEVDAALLDVWLATSGEQDGLTTGELAQIRRDGARHLPQLERAAAFGFASYAAAVRDRRGV